VDDDARLMLSFQQGNVHDFERLIERHHQSVISLAYRFLNDRAAAEDVAQDVFLRLFSSADSYKPTASFTTLLYTITRNACYSELRRRRLRPAAIDGESDDPPAEAAPDHLEQAELREAVRAAIASLPHNQRMAVLLRRYEGLSYEQIAAVTGTSVSAVKALLHRARQALKGRLKGKL